MLGHDRLATQRIFIPRSCVAPTASALVHLLPETDYMNVTLLPNAATVLGLIAGWFEDYNDNHPHSGLKMRSSREFIANQTATA